MNPARPCSLIRTISRDLDRYDHRVRTRAEQYMAFAQLTSGTRDIETCLSVHASKGCQPVADAGRCHGRDWRIHAALAHGEDAVRRDGVLTNTVYALDSTTIALCLSVFPWAHFRAAVKMHTARPAGQHSEFYPHLGWQAARVPSICSCRKPEPSTSWIVLRRLCPPLCVAPSRGLLRHACQVEHRCSSVYSAPTDR